MEKVRNQDLILSSCSQNDKRFTATTKTSDDLPTILNGCIGCTSCLNSAYRGRYSITNSTTLTKTANENVLVGINIEGEDAINNIDQILAIAELDLSKRKAILSIKLLEEIEKKEALDKYGSEGSGKNLPFSSLSEDLKKKDKEKD